MTVAQPLLSATRTSKLKLPVVVGVPPIAPAGESVSPGGRVPLARVNVYGGAPPDAVMVALYWLFCVARGSVAGVSVIVGQVPVTVSE